MQKFLNPAWAILEYLWYPILVFAATPFFLKTLGADRYGLWVLLTATVGVGAILNTGTGAATIKLTSENLGKNNPDELNLVVRNALAIALVGGGCLSIAVLMVFFFGGDFLFAKMGDRNLVYLTGIAAALLTWVEQIDNVFASVIKGAEKFGRIARLEIASKSIQIVFALGAVAAGGGLLFLYVTLFLVSLIRMVAKARLARNLLGISSFTPKFRQSSEFLRLSKWGWLQGLGAMLFNSADRFAVGSIFGATTLSHYSIILMLPQQIHAVAAAGLSVIFPMVSRKSVSGEPYYVDKSMMGIMLAGFFLSACSASFLLAFGDGIFTLWLRDPLPASVLEAFKYLVVAYLILALNIVPHYILLGLGRVRFIALSNLAAGTVSLLLMVGLAHKYGLASVGACRILYAVIASANFVPLFIHMRRSQITKR